MEVALEALNTLIYDPGEVEEASADVIDITGGILDMMNAPAIA